MYVSDTVVVFEGYDQKCVGLWWRGLEKKYVDILKNTAFRQAIDRTRDWHEALEHHVRVASFHKVSGYIDKSVSTLDVTTRQICPSE